MSVLVVEDNYDLCANICEYLESEGFEVDSANDGLTALHILATNQPKCLVLDLMIPGIDGLSLCRHIRQNGSTVPIIMLTARDTLPDKLEGFRAGTDDYLVKPFDLEELCARIRAMLLRGPRQANQTLQVGDLVFDQARMEVRRNDQKIELNHVCLKILAYLMNAAPKVVTREELSNHLWGDMPPGSDALRSHIYTLRQAVDKPFEQALIHTIRNIGFRMMHETK